MDKNVDNGNNQERLFTEDEVNEIVRKRLERYKEKHSGDEETTKLTDALNERSAELDKREFNIDCRNYLSEMGFDPGMMDVISADNLDDFKAKAHRLAMIIHDSKTPVPPSFNPETARNDNSSDKIAEAFSIDYQRQPKEI